VNTGHLGALWLWAPDINLFKDPRWGRGQEVPGEVCVVRLPCAVYDASIFYFAPPSLPLYYSIRTRS
jgi:hypothetical protein